MKIITFILLVLLVLFSAGCNKKQDTQQSLDVQHEESHDITHADSLLTGFEVINRITVSAVSNKIVEFVYHDIAEFVENSILIEAIKKSNAENSSRTQEQIDEADTNWRGTEGIGGIINDYITNSAASFLKNVKEDSNGIIVEIFAMDFQGCNVAMSDKTSDFWQGDEDKFIITFNNGNGAIFIDSIEYDESTKQELLQVSVPVKDPESNNVIGAITIGIDIDKL